MLAAGETSHRWLFFWVIFGLPLFVMQQLELVLRPFLASQAYCA